MMMAYGEIEEWQPANGVEIYRPSPRTLRATHSTQATSSSPLKHITPNFCEVSFHLSYLIPHFEQVIYHQYAWFRGL
jgi:hypothetical protein